MIAIRTAKILRRRLRLSAVLAAGKGRQVERAVPTPQPGCLPDRTPGRQFVFIATSSPQFVSDDVGGRRWFPIESAMPSPRQPRLPDAPTIAIGILIGALIALQVAGYHPFSTFLMAIAQ